MHDKKDEKEWADLETCRISTDQKGNKSMLRVGFEFFACGGPKPHELESCPLDHSGIVALSDQQWAAGVLYSGRRDFSPAMAARDVQENAILDSKRRRLS